MLKRVLVTSFLAGFGLWLQACGPGGESCQPQGVCVNRGGETYDLCCVVGGSSCRYVFKDGHVVGPFNPNTESKKSLDEASAYCLNGGADAGP